MKTIAHKPALDVPGPSPVKVFGRATNAFRFAKDSIGYTRQLFQNYGPIVSLSYGGGTNIYSPLLNCPGTVFAYGPELVRQVATQHEIYYKHPLSGKLYRKGTDSERTEPLKHFVVGLFGVNSDQHRQHRQLLMPAFHKQQVESYCNDIVAITQSVLDHWQIGEPSNIAEVMRLLTLRVATKTLFGEDIGEGGGCTGRLLQDALALLSSPLIALLPLDLPGLPYHRFLNLITRLDEEMRGMIAHKRAAGGGDKDVLSMLIQACDETGAVLNEDELLGHAGVIFAAGHETSSNALTWTLFLLSQHPQVAADLLDELQGVLQGEAPKVEQLPRLPLLEKVIKESMRVLPPVPWNGRVTAQPTQLGGYALPQGTEVLVSIYQTHHMPELYPRPELFNPRRWETIEPTIFEYNPFSAGPRMCIGVGFAMMEMKIVLAMLLQRYRLQFIPQKIDRYGVIVMAPKDGMSMLVHKQDRQFAQGVGGVRGNVREMVDLAG
ncbi:cytochrome P450 hydroxylase [uncultured Synechococcales cyanobacterium]|uniref:Cytochrome P450 hydroxylase n=1 Tax=uncultured Synechococcales cyanobacterium TaxID=1936017 RepID=A0A6J4VA08_9CYAN|nr:cytochrome P450 hydroxylase [uncultured Synechococcales cyanobacterium]